MSEAQREVVPNFVNLDELERQARDKLGPSAYDFIAGGAGSEQTLFENRDAFARIALIPRVLTGIKSADTSTTVFGQKLSMPIYVTAMANQSVAHTLAEVGTAVGASRAGTLSITPTSSSRPTEEVARAAGTGPRWFQLYFSKEEKVNLDLLSRAENAGYSAIVLTVDLPVLGIRERNIRNYFDGANATAAESTAAEMRHLQTLVSGVKTDLDWEDYEWTRENTRLPVFIKGILSVEDAAEAARRKVPAIVVSNHGGRQLDTGLGAVMALPSIVESVAGKTRVFFDSGIRRGIDVFKAIALGADAVGVGRPVLYGLAVYGVEGVTAVLQHLRDELVNVMRLSGVAKISDITSAYVKLRAD